MHHLKEILKKMGIFHVVTFADNNAIEYFAKQGFKGVAVSDSENDSGIVAEVDGLDFEQLIKAKYVKIYNGARFMHSRIIKNVNYCKLNEHLLQNRQSLVDRIGLISHSLQRQSGKLKIGKITKTKLFENKWSAQSMEVRAKISGILKQLQCHSKVGVFSKAVDPIQAGNYYKVIKEPMDLGKMQRKMNEHQYKSMTHFVSDFKLMIANCKIYNPKENVYHSHAIEFDQYFDSLMQKL